MPRHTAQDGILEQVNHDLDKGVTDLWLACGGHRYGRMDLLLQLLADVDGPAGAHDNFWKTSEACQFARSPAEHRLMIARQARRLKGLQLPMSCTGLQTLQATRLSCLHHVCNLSVAQVDGHLDLCCFGHLQTVYPFVPCSKKPRSIRRVKV